MDKTGRSTHVNVSRRGKGPRSPLSLPQPPRATPWDEYSSVRGCNVGSDESSKEQEEERGRKEKAMEKTNLFFPLSSPYEASLSLALFF